MRQAEKERKEFQTRIPLTLNSGGVNSEKNSKKIQKIREQLFGIIFSQIEMRQAEKEGKEFQTPIPLTLEPAEKIPKKQQKKMKKLVKNYSALFLAKSG